jgi:thioredoxin reductase (NADPH)
MRADCVVVGGGPGGLTAAVYLARYLRDVVVLDDGRSRALWIARSHNCPGYPNGIPGPELLDRLRRQAVRYGAPILPGRAEALEGGDRGRFVAIRNQQTIVANAVLLATGAEDVQPPISDLHGATGLASCVTARPAMPTRCATGGYPSSGAGSVASRKLCCCVRTPPISPC